MRTYTPPMDMLPIDRLAAWVARQSGKLGDQIRAYAASTRPDAPGRCRWCKDPVSVEAGEFCSAECATDHFTAHAA
jgi:hypothetical protein